MKLPFFRERTLLTGPQDYLKEVKSNSIMTFMVSSFVTIGSNQLFIALVDKSIKGRHLLSFSLVETGRALYDLAIG